MQQQDWLVVVTIKMGLYIYTPLSQPSDHNTVDTYKVYISPSTVSCPEYTFSVCDTRYLTNT